MMKRLTRESVLAGTTERAWVEIGDGAAMRIRPLTDGELAQVELVGMEGLPESLVPKLGVIKSRQARVNSLRTIAAMPGKDRGAAEKAQQEADNLAAKPVEGVGPKDLAALHKCNARCDRLAAAFALSCDGEEWSEQDAEKLPRGLPKLLAEHALSLSGATKEGAANARGFRLDDAGPGDAGAEQAGIPPGK